MTRNVLPHMLLHELLLSGWRQIRTLSAQKMAGLLAGINLRQFGHLLR